MSKLQKTILGIGFSSAILVILFPTYHVEGTFYLDLSETLPGAPWQENLTPFKSRQRAFLFTGPRPEFHRGSALDPTGQPCEPSIYSGTRDLAVKLDLAQLGAELLAIAAVTSALLLVLRRRSWRKERRPGVPHTGDAAHA